MAKNLREVIQRLKEQNSQMSKKSSEPVEEPKKSKPVEVKEDEYEDDVKEEEPEQKSRPKLEIPREEVRPEPKQKENPEDLIGAEIGILQNNGIFRRELLQNLIGINDSLTIIANALGKLGGLDK